MKMLSSTSALIAFAQSDIEQALKAARPHCVIHAATSPLQQKGLALRGFAAWRYRFGY
ncbi:hypothetical protein [Chitinivorax sp. B]|uniref:hypothetical protein n=1 Tax=Chitinivorax sp. B TaxID=2502235 RepID=UPI001485BDD8|nr:hypothetical protein [Chitinivorax sp. B]